MSKLDRLFFETEADKHLKTLPIGDQLNVHEIEEEQKTQLAHKAVYDSARHMLFMNLSTNDRVQAFLEEKKPVTSRLTQDGAAPPTSPLIKYATEAAAFVPERARKGYAVQKEDLPYLRNLCLAQCVTPNTFRKLANSIVRSPSFEALKNRAEVIFDLYKEWSEIYSRGLVVNIKNAGNVITISRNGEEKNVPVKKVFMPDFNYLDVETGIFASIIRNMAGNKNTPESRLILTAKYMRIGCSTLKGSQVDRYSPVCYKLDESGEIDHAIIVHPIYWTDELSYLHENGISYGLD